VIPFVVGLRPNHEIGFEQTCSNPAWHQKPEERFLASLGMTAKSNGEKRKQKIKAKAKQKPNPKEFVSERVAYFDETADSSLAEFGAPGG
jgi:hypothetical protein